MDKPVTIVVDSRESRAGTATRLAAIPGVTVIQKELPSGDYIIGEGVAVERKAAVPGGRASRRWTDHGNGLTGAFRLAAGSVFGLQDGLVGGEGGWPENGRRDPCGAGARSPVAKRPGGEWSLGLFLAFA